MDLPPEKPFRLSSSVVLYHNPVEQVVSTVESLARAVAVAWEADLVSEVRLSLVDNSCDTAYGEMVQRAISPGVAGTTLQIDYIPHAENRGFGAGHNSVLKTTDSDVHLVLNPDVELHEKALYAGLSRLQQEPGIALLSPYVCGEDGRQEFLCKRYPSVLVLLLRAFTPLFVQNWFRGRMNRYEMVDLCGSGELVDVTLASGCFMLAATPALQAVGGFNERYFLYFEDFDLSLRLGGQGRLVFDPEIRIVHHGGYAGRKGLQHVRYFVESGFRFFNEYGWRFI